MTIQKPTGPHAADMTAGPAWPDADEDRLQHSADEFTAAHKTVTAQLEALRHQRTEMFDSAGGWQGGAAKAARGKHDKHVADMESLQQQLQASANLYRNSASAVRQAKNTITKNVEDAQEHISKNIENNSDLSSQDKSTQIQQIVSTTHKANVEAAGDPRSPSGASYNPPAAAPSANGDSAERNPQQPVARQAPAQTAPGISTPPGQQTPQPVGPQAAPRIAPAAYTPGAGQPSPQPTGPQPPPQIAPAAYTPSAGQPSP
jgi:uncharacterized protein YukE